MTPERWQQVRGLLHGAMQLKPAARDAFLAQRCSGDSALRQEVDSFLAALPESGEDVLEVPLDVLLSETPSLGSTVAPNEANEPALAGTVISHYQILEKIGAGGMGVVYKAEDQNLGRTVALKFLSERIAKDQKAIERFRREARAASALNHPNICTVHDMEQHDGRNFIVMEFVEGIPLSKRVAKGPMCQKDVVEMGVQIADALGAAHEKGIFHRDLKPANILVTTRGQVKIVDFGLAKLTQTRSDATHNLAFSESHTAMGTLPYMAPEQLRGEAVDARTDIWGAGSVLYEMCTGQRPFSALRGALLLDAILNRAPQRPREIGGQISDTLERVILKAIEKNPGQRYQTTQQLAQDLEHIRTGTAPRSYGRLKWWLAACVVIVVAVASWITFKRPKATATVPHVRRSIAILGFKDLAGRPDAAWLSDALSEMLTTELEAGQQLRTISGESVARAKNDLKLIDSGSLAGDTLSLIRKRLASDLIVRGSYIDLGKDAGGQIRLDLQIQDTRSGETVFSLTENGTEPGLLDLVSRTGDDLRERLGAGKVSESERARLRASQPSSVEAAHLYAEALAKLRVFDPLGASTLLQRAITADPNDPYMHAALAEAWSGLGYGDRGRDEAKQAFDLSANLPPLSKQLNEARYRLATAQWEQAIAICRDLFAAAPDNLDYGLLLTTAQIQGGRSKDALQTVSMLRRIPPPQGEDPRIDQAEADATNAISDYRRELVAAGIAAEKGESQGGRLIVAQARIAEGRAFRNLGELDRAMAVSETARSLFAAAGDRMNEARALHNIGAVAYDRGDLSGARRAFEEAFAIRHQIGNRAGAAAEMNALAVVLAHQKDIAGAMKAYNESVKISRDLNNLAQVGVTLNNLGELQRNINDYSAARKSFREALEADRKVGVQSEIASVMSNIGLMLTTEGDLAGARSNLEQALQISRNVGNKFGIGAALINLAEVQFALGDLAGAEKLDTESYEVFQSSGQAVFASWPLYGLADIQLQRDDLTGARQKYEATLKLRQEAGEKKETAESLRALSDVYREQGQLSEAERAAGRALPIFQEAEDFEGQSRTQVSLAMIFLAESKLPEAQIAIKQARNLSKESPSASLKIEVDLADARVRIAKGDSAGTISLLRHCLDRARRIGLAELEFEARLSLSEIDKKRGQMRAATAALIELQKEASAKDYRLLARKAGTILALN